jgi:hypothetical protein
MTHPRPQFHARAGTITAIAKPKLAMKVLSSARAIRPRIAAGLTTAWLPSINISTPW